MKYKLDIAGPRGYGWVPGRGRVVLPLALALHVPMSAGCLLPADAIWYLRVSGTLVCADTREPVTGKRIQLRLSSQERGSTASLPAQTDEHGRFSAEFHSLTGTAILWPLIIALPAPASPLPYDQVMIEHEPACDSEPTTIVRLGKPERNGNRLRVELGEAPWSAAPDGPSSDPNAAARGCGATALAGAPRSDWQRRSPEVHAPHRPAAHASGRYSLFPVPGSPFPFPGSLFSVSLW